MSNSDIICYIQMVVGKQLQYHQISYIQNLFEYFYFDYFPIENIKFDICCPKSGIEQHKLDMYKTLPFDEFPPIVLGEDGLLIDGCHRILTAKTHNLKAIQSYVGVLKPQINKL